MVWLMWFLCYGLGTSWQNYIKCFFKGLVHISVFEILDINQIEVYKIFSTFDFY
jgi:hypothetical protein